jgi:hypothetical protein
MTDEPSLIDGPVPLCDHCAEGFHGDCLGGSQRVFGLPICPCDCPDARSARRMADQP